MLSTTSRITCFVNNLPQSHSIVGIEYSDGALHVESGHGLLKRLGYMPRTSKPNPAVGVDAESTYLYSAMATIRLPEKDIHDFLRFARWGFDVLVEYKSGDVDLCDALLDCLPIYGVSNQILCSVEDIVWNGVPSERVERWKKLCDEAERHHRRQIVSQ